MRLNQSLLSALLGVLLLQGCCTPPAPEPVQDDPKGLPASFIDHVPITNNKPIAFKMILVPGDPETGIVPFYISETEVTNSMFLDWAWGNDVKPIERAELERRGLRPSVVGMGHPPFELGLIEENYPAMSMSWRTARAYCIWLSEKTGRTYRLPTDTEWQHALKLGGGVPEDRDDLLAQGLFSDNALRHQRLPLFCEPRLVGQGKPNALGVYDMLGNVSEWVQPMGGKRWVRGGHFMMLAEAFSKDWILIEDQEVWNETYPQIPVSKYWYIDEFHQGIRLVCEVEAEAQ